MRGRWLPEWPWRDRRTVAVDVLLWLGGCLPMVLGQVAPQLADELWWRIPLVVLAVSVLVAAVRLVPLVALVAVLGYAAVDANAVYLAPVLAFLAGRRTARAQPSLVLFTTVVVVGTVLTPLLGVPVGEWLNGMVVLLLTMLLPWLAGRSWRQYRELMDAGWQRADQLEREQRIVTDRARLRERARIAQDMHDSLGHELSLLGLRAGALELAPDLDEQQRAAAHDLRAGAANATERLREIIGLLRDDTEAAPVEPVHETVAELVQRTAASGLDVRLVEDGDGEPGLLVERAAYRVVQEALTNAAKHAPGAQVTVAVARTGEETVVTVVNGPANRQAPDGQPSGHGLLGLRERVRLAGGTLRSGPTDGGGFTVTATLPHGAAPSPEPATDADGTESARRLADARRRARRSLVLFVAVPTGVAAVLVAVVAVQYAYNVYRSTMTPAAYEQLRVGQSRADVTDLLPPREYEERPRVIEPEAPADASCAYYRVERNILNLPSDVYRVCFVDGQLASKHRIDGDSPRPTGSS